MSKLCSVFTYYSIDEWKYQLLFFILIQFRTEVICGRCGERQRERERERETATEANGGKLCFIGDAVNCYKYTALAVYELNMSMGIDVMVQTGTTQSNRRTSFRSAPHFQQKSHMYWRGIERRSPR